MQMQRSIKRLHPAIRDDIADLITRRPLPSGAIDQIDPFLFLNHHGPQVYGVNNNGLPFGPHPHRGFETVTFILKGDIAHHDSSGHESVIKAGGVQWMTAGRGLVHSEVSSDEFMDRGGDLEILQLWVNLPSRLKMTDPRYVGLQQDQIPVFKTDDGRVAVHLISGQWEGHTGPVPSLIDVHMMTMDFTKGGKANISVPSTRNIFFYVVRGELNVNGQDAKAFHLVEFNNDGEDVSLEALSDSVILFGHAEPLRESVVAHGPFVMNTRDEIIQAIHDYQDGKFG